MGKSGKASHIMLKIFKWTLIVLMVTAAALLVLDKTGILVASFKPLVQLELRKALKREVSVARIEGGIFSNITLYGVKIAAKNELKDGVLIAIDSVTINFTLKDVLFNGKQLQETIQSIYIVRPSLFIERDGAGAFNFTSLLDSIKSVNPGQARFSGKVYVQRGFVGFRDEQVRFNSSLTDLSAELELSGDIMSLNFEGSAFKNGKANISGSGTINLKTGVPALKVTASEMNLPHYANYFRELSGAKGFEFTGGKAEASAIFGTENSAVVAVKEGVIDVKGLTRPVRDFSCNLSIDGKRLQISKFNAVLDNAGVAGKAEIADITKPSIDGSLYAYRLNLKDLESFELFKGLRLSGIATFSSSFTGEFSDLRLSASGGFADAGIAGMKVDKADFSLSLDKNRLKLEKFTATAFTGVHEFSGSFDFKKKHLKFRGKSKDIEINNIFTQLLAYKDLSSTADLDTVIDCPVGSFSALTSAVFKDLKLKEGSFGQVNGTLRFHGENKLRVDLSAKGGSLAGGEFVFYRDRTELSSKIALKDFPLASAADCIAGRSLKLGGSISSGVIDTSGPMNDMIVHVAAAIQNPVVDELVAKSAVINLSLQQNTLAIKTFELKHDDRGILTAGGSLRLDGDGKMDFAVDFKDFDVSKIPYITARYPKTTGRITLTGSVGGTLKKPLFAVKISRARLALSGDNSFEASGGVSYNGVSYSFNRLSIKDDDQNHANGFELDGSVTGKNVSLEMDVRKGKLTTLADLTGVLYAKADLSGRFSGTGRLVGGVSDLTGYGSLVFESGAVLMGQKIDVGRLNFQVKEGVLNLSKLEFKTQAFDLSNCAGAFSLAGNAQSTFVFDLTNRFSGSSLSGTYRFKGALSPKEGLPVKGYIETGNLFYTSGSNAVPVKLADLSAGCEYSTKSSEFQFFFDRWESLRSRTVFNVSTGAFTSRADILKGFNLKRAGQIEKSLSGAGGLLDEGALVLTGGGRQLLTGALKNVKGRNISLNGVVAEFFSAEAASFSGGESPKVSLRNCVLSQKEGNVRVEGDINFKGKVSAETSSTDLYVSFSNTRLAYLAQILGLKNNISGTAISLAPGVHVTGSLSALQASGDVTLSKILAEGTDLGNIEASFNYRERVLQFRKLIFRDVDHRAGFDNIVKPNSGRAVLRFKPNKDIEVSVKGSAYFEKLIGFNVDAGIEANLVIENQNGKDIAPVLSGKFALDGFKLNGYSVGNMSFSGKYSTNELMLFRDQAAANTASGGIGFIPNGINFKNFSAAVSGGTVALSGSLSKDSDLKIEVKRLDTKFIFKYFRVDFDMTGYATAEVKLTGDQLSPKVTVLSGGHVEAAELFNLKFDTITGELQYNTDKSGRYDGKEIFRLLGISAVYKENFIEKYRLDVKGSIPVNPKEKDEVDLSIDIKDADLAIIKITDWFSDVKGKLNAHLNVRGKIDYPDLYDSFLTIEDGADLYPLTITKKIENVRAKFTIGKSSGRKFDGSPVYDMNRVNIEYATGEIDGQPIEFLGNFTVRKYKPDDLTDLRIRMPRVEGKKGGKVFIKSMMQTEGTAYIKGFDDEFFRLSGKVPNFTVAGEVYLNDTKFTYPPVLENENGEYPLILKQMGWNLRVVFQDNVRYYNSYANIKLKNGGEIKAKGIGSDLDLKGKVEAEGGTFNYYLSEFDVKQGVFKFSENEKRTPLMSATAEITKTFDNRPAKITAVLGGESETSEFGVFALEEKERRLKIRFSSDRNLSQQEIASTLTVGTTDIKGLSAFETAFYSVVAQAISSALGSLVDLGPMKVSVSRDVGSFSDVPYDYNLQTQKSIDILEGMKIAVETQIFASLLARGSVTFGKQDQVSGERNVINSLEIIYQYNPNVTISMSGDSNSNMKIGLGVYKTLSDLEFYGNKKEKKSK